MHDHIASTFPDLCPMAGPGRMGEPPSHARPVPVGVGGPAPHGATKAAETGPGGRVRGGRSRRQGRPQGGPASSSGNCSTPSSRARPASKTRGPSSAWNRAAEPVTKAAAGGDPAAHHEPATRTSSSPLSPKRTAPLVERLDAQQKLLDAMADQPDPRVAAYRGVAYNQTPAPPAGLLNSPDQRPAGVPDAAYKAMYDQWRNSPDPELRENALKFLMERTGLTQNARA